MRFYGSGDARNPAKKSWSKQNLKSMRAVNYYRDLEGINIENVTRKELYLGHRPESRINPWACLPYYYPAGARYIKIEKAGPVGFKCAEFPMSINEIRKKNDQLQHEREQRRKAAYQKKKFKDQCREAITWRDNC